MGLKEWFARKTSSPSGFAQAYVSGLLEQIEFLTASVAAFSGRKPLGSPTDTSAAVFETHFAMEQAGFGAVTRDIAVLTAPTIKAVRLLVEPAFLCEAYLTNAAFLCLYSAHAARSHFSAPNANEFASALKQHLAERTAGSYGLSPDPRQVREALNRLAPSFFCDRFLNVESFGRNDGLGLILGRLVVSPDGGTQFAFVVGSRTQPAGFASMFASVIQGIDRSLAACAKSMGW